MKTRNLVLSFLTISLLLFMFVWVYEKPEEKIIAEAMWASSSKTIVDLAREADVIVRVQVESVAPTRLLVKELPISAKPQDDYSEEPVWSGENEEIVLPFTDTYLKILEVYKGDKVPGELITVAQTGGLLPEQDDQPSRLFELSEDPLYKLGEEYVLFLWDASGDEVHAPDRELYLVMTPFARYRIKRDGTVYNYSDATNLPAEFGFPANIEDLEKQIMSAIGSGLEGTGGIKPSTP